MEIKHFYAADDFTGEQCVLLSDHVASHAYDEAKERELARFYYEADISKTATWHDFLYGWLACAQSRARSAE